MPLTNCPDCRHEIAKVARACPQCGSRPRYLCRYCQGEKKCRDCAENSNIQLATCPTCKGTGECPICLGSGRSWTR